MITPIPIKGFGTVEQRAYLLLSLAVGCFGISRERQIEAAGVWRRFVAMHPRFKSPLVPDAADPPPPCPCRGGPGSPDPGQASKHP